VIHALLTPNVSGQQSREVIPRLNLRIRNDLEVVIVDKTRSQRRKIESGRNNHGNDHRRGNVKRLECVYVGAALG